MGRESLQSSKGRQTEANRTSGQAFHLHLASNNKKSSEILRNRGNEGTHLSHPVWYWPVTQAENDNPEGKTQTGRPRIPVSVSFLVVVLVVVWSLSDPLRPHGLYSPPGSSVCGLSQVRRLEWVAIPFSRGIFPTRDRSCVSCIAVGFFAAKSQQGSPLSFLLISEIVVQRVGWMCTKKEAKLGLPWWSRGYEPTVQ